MSCPKESLSAEYTPIADYALIGDCRTAALISKEGSIDWFCPGRFDAPAVFCQILDANKGGFLRLQPEGAFSSSRRYIGDTNVLETSFSSDVGDVRILDFMPAPYDGHIDPREPGSSVIVRMIEAVRGDASIEMSFKATFDYARENGVFESPNGTLLAATGGQWLALGGSVLNLQATDGGHHAAVLRLRQGEQVAIIVSAASSRQGALKGIKRTDPEAELNRTLEYWREWTARCIYQGPYRSDVVRSALVLKLLTYQPTGAIVAAPTTSLPEEIGGPRNWDYRFSWLRDSSFILFALCTIGFQDEARAFLAWLEKAVGPRVHWFPQIMYTIEGGKDLPEMTLGHLDGYQGSRPVRVGNAAALQKQFDIYGEILISAYVHYQIGKMAPSSAAAPSPNGWRFLRKLVEDAIRVWRRKDHGMWEVRGQTKHFLHSKLMCWAAVDRGIAISEHFNLEADLDRWKATRHEMRATIEENGYNNEVGAFVQAYGSTALDASALAIPRIGFLPATDPRVKSTIDKIREQLLQDGLVYRYRSEDGLEGGEGAFLMCSFWLVEAMALAGDIAGAKEMFEHLLSLSNEVGLFSEEIDPKSGAFLGNFPQGFTHLALIEAAVNLAKVTKLGPEEEPQTEGERVLPAAKAVANAATIEKSDGF